MAEDELETTGPADTPWEGVVAVEDTITGDDRMLTTRSLTWTATTENPLPLRFWPTGTHEEAVVVGTVERIWRSGAEIRGAGVVHTGSTDVQTAQLARRVVELADEGVAGLSVGVDQTDVEIRIDAELIREMQAMEQAWIDSWENDTSPPEMPEPEVTRDGDGKERVTIMSFKAGEELVAITAGRVREVTVTDQPAIPETRMTVREAAVAASLTLRTPGSGLVVRRGLAVAASVARGQADTAFGNPGFGADGDTDSRLVWQTPLRNDEVGHWGCPLTVTADGQVYGHLATRGRCHGSYPDTCLNLDALDPTYSFDEYLTGEAVPGVRTGPLVLDTTHSINRDGTIKDWSWLENTGQAVADVTTGVDGHGIWVAGRLRPGVT